jgi:peptidyl-prolyl cis-trans isomerase C
MDKSGDVVSSKSAPGALSQETDTPARTPLTRWLREPLVHFLLIGLLLFVAYGVRSHSAGQQFGNRIQLTLDDVGQLQIGFAAQWQRQPTPEELSGLVESRVREEILYREALTMGLDKDDTIVKRRMAQKMEFLSEDVANAHEPSSAELKIWYEKNGDKLAQPSRATFRHLYFSPDHRGQRAHNDAGQALSKIAGEPQDSKIAAALADRFMFQDYYGDRSPEQLAKEFGPQFAQSIFKLKPGSWQGPIESGYGWHLVFVQSFTPGRIPAFEEVEPAVKTAWLSDQRAEEWRKTYATMRAKYQVVLPAAAASDEPRVASAPPAKMVAPTSGLQ